jgi:hypothetical protein
MCGERKVCFPAPLAYWMADRPLSAVRPVRKWTYPGLENSFIGPRHTVVL